METNAALLKDLRADQKTLVDRALDERKNILKITDTAISNGATQDIVSRISASATAEAAQSILAQSGFGVSPLDKQRIGGEGDKQLSPLDVARLRQDFPDANIVFGDTENMAAAKISQVSAPREFSLDELRTNAQEAKDKGKSKEEAIRNIQNTADVLNKQDALAVVEEVYAPKKGPWERLFGGSEERREVIPTEPDFFEGAFDDFEAVTPEDLFNLPSTFRF